MISTKLMCCVLVRILDNWFNHGQENNKR
uniref:Uncharacterized protein n=1 Tax=Rhizophora mucronata TaxID=61149 RepID=A0A2P2NMM5_RHIMU